MLKKLWCFFWLGVVFSQQVFSSSVGQVLAQSSQIGAISDKLLPDDSGMDDLTKKLEEEKKNPFDIPHTYNHPVQKAENTPLFVLKKVIVKGNKKIPTADLSSTWVSHVGKKIGFNELSDIAYEITKIYRHQGYFLSYAVIPEQDVMLSQGQITFRVIEGYVNYIEIQKEDGQEIPEKIKVLSEYFRSNPLHLDSFERGLLLIRDLYPNSRVLFEPSSVNAEGATRIKLIIPPKKSVHASASVQNYGTSTVGPMLYNVGLVIAPGWDEEHKIDLFYQQAFLAKELQAITGGYTVPIDDDGTTMNVRSSYLDSNPSSILNISKQEKKITAAILHPFIRSQDLNMYSGFELRYINQQQFISDFSQLTKERVRQLKLLQLFDWTDSWAGQNSLQLKGIFGLKVLHPISDNSPYKSRALGRGTPMYFNMNFSRLQRLAGPFSVRFQVDSQYAACTLLSVDRFYSSGPPTNGAYPVASLSGDSGMESKIEFMYSWNQDLQLFSYLSQINIWNRVVLQGVEGNYAVGRGAGLGMRFNYRQLSASLEYGYPFIAPVGGQSVNPHILFSLSGHL